MGVWASFPYGTCMCTLLSLVLSVQFSERMYWDKRYQQDPTTFEWYRSYDSLEHILTQ